MPELAETLLVVFLAVSRVVSEVFVVSMVLIGMFRDLAVRFSASIQGQHQDTAYLYRDTACELVALVMAQIFPCDFVERQVVIRVCMKKDRSIGVWEQSKFGI